MHACLPRVSRPSWLPRRPFLEKQRCPSERCPLHRDRDRRGPPRALPWSMPHVWPRRAMRSTLNATHSQCTPLVTHAHRTRGICEMQTCRLVSVAVHRPRGDSDRNKHRDRGRDGCRDGDTWAGTFLRSVLRLGRGVPLLAGPCRASLCSLARLSRDGPSRPGCRDGPSRPGCGAGRSARSAVRLATERRRLCSHCMALLASVLALSRCVVRVPPKCRRMPRYACFWIGPRPSRLERGTTPCVAASGLAGGPFLRRSLGFP